MANGEDVFFDSRHFASELSEAIAIDQSIAGQ